MINSEDQAKLEQFVKELKDLPSYKSEILFQVFAQGDVLSLIEVLRNDDGIVDSAELELLGWYLNVYLNKYKSEPGYCTEAINLIHKEARMAFLGQK